MRTRWAFIITCHLEGSGPPWTYLARHAVYLADVFMIDESRPDLVTLYNMAEPAEYPSLPLQGVVWAHERNGVWFCCCHNCPVLT